LLKLVFGNFDGSLYSKTKTGKWIYANFHSNLKSYQLFLLGMAQRYL
jgi:hypothetical protein